MKKNLLITCVMLLFAITSMAQNKITISLVYSTRLRVSVCGTGTSEVMFSGFSRQSAYPHYWIVPKDVPYCQVRLFPWICLRKSTSTLFNRLFRQPAAVSLLRPHVTLKGSNGILTVSAIGLAVRLNLRTVIVTAAVYWGFNSMLLLR